MAIPPTALVWPEPMDPSDIVDFTIDLNPLLVEDEMVDTYELAVTAESDLLGLELGTGSYAAYVGSGVIHLWLNVDPAFQANPLFSGAGVPLPIEITFQTDSTPPRQRQRTVVVRVVQR